MTQTFDLDGLRLVSLAASIGVVAAVPETPTAPPVWMSMSATPGGKTARRRRKHGGTRSSVTSADRVADWNRLGGGSVESGDRGSRGVHRQRVGGGALQGLPGLELEPSVTEEVLNAPDPVAAGIEAAVAEAHALLSIQGVDGINISGLASASGARVAAEIKSEVGRRIRAETAP